MTEDVSVLKVDVCWYAVFCDSRESGLPDAYNLHAGTERFQVVVELEALP